MEPSSVRSTPMCSSATALSEKGAREAAAAFGHELIEAVGDEVDRIEAVLSEKMPRVKHIDIEPD